jgi:hypothetical protein
MTQRFEQTEQPFIEPVTIARFERGYFNGREEQLTFETSEYRSRPTFWLRVVVRNRRGGWSWAPARPSSTGRYWQSLCIKPRELRLLAAAMSAAADALEHQSDGAQPEAAPGKPARSPNAREQRELSKLDEHPICTGDDDIPF